MRVSVYGEHFCSPLNVVLSTIPSEVDKMEARLNTAENRPPRTYDQSDYGPYGYQSLDSHGKYGRKPGRNRRSRVSLQMKIGLTQELSHWYEEDRIPGTEPCDCPRCKDWTGGDFDPLVRCTKWLPEDWAALDCEEQWYQKRIENDADSISWELQDRWEKYCSFLIEKTWGSWDFYEDIIFDPDWEDYELDWGGPMSIYSLERSPYERYNSWLASMDDH